MHLDIESQYFLIAIIAMLVIGLPIIITRVSVPAQLSFEEVMPAQLTPRQAEYFKACDTKLSSLGYHPFITFRTGNLSRAYASSSDPTRILVSLVTAPGGKGAQNYVEMITRYGDGVILTTKNSHLSTVFSNLPGHIVQVYPGIDDLAELKRRHDMRGASLVGHAPVYRGEGNFFSDFEDYHKRFCEYQASKGLLKYDRGARVYRATAWTGLRGIGNFLNPLADNFTLARFGAGVIFGTVLPLVVIYHPAALIDWWRFHSQLNPALFFLSALLAAFTVAGIAVGCTFKQKSFLWAFLLGYVPLRLLRPASKFELVFSLWMAAVAEFVARWRMRRERLV